MKELENIKCIYCEKSPPVVTFNNREHVIPQFLGRFTPENLYFQGNIVCDKCNAEFSSLETVFAEDSLEGLIAIIYAIREVTTIRSRGDRLKYSTSGCLQEFENIFPFVSPEGQTVYPKPMVRMKNKDGTYQVILIEEIAKMNENTKEFQEKKKWMKTLSQKGIMFWGNREFPPKKIASIMKKFDVDIDLEKSKLKHINLAESIENQIKIHFEGKIDNTLLRVPAKIAFNYFAYCAKQSNMRDSLFDKEFDNIRNYIKYGTYNEQRPIIPTNESILYDEKDSKKVRLVHLVCFIQENNQIIGKVSLLGRFTYKVILGNNPFKVSFDRRRFGCGTCFNPFSGEIMKLSSIPYFLITSDKYGLFCR